jgi:redox-sensitive bicupin YhaK (pirin superfamily)
MGKTREIRTIHRSQPAIEGAGVRLKRAFALREVPAFDPFLLLDDFRADNPRQYLLGFPWHPHRGIETITYMLEGRVEHGDSLGNRGSIGPGDVQWMTAGSGIIHMEMPKGDLAGRMGGFQLWANLPAGRKMMPPRYREVKREQIPEVDTGGGAVIRVICGEVPGARGPVRDAVIDPSYLDVRMQPESRFVHPTPPGHTVFAYFIGGRAWCGELSDPPTEWDGRERETDPPTAAKPLLTDENLALFEDGEQVVVQTGEEPVRFLLVSGRPLGEPIAWQGPIVMNTQEELDVAFEEYRTGKFIRPPEN